MDGKERTKETLIWSTEDYKSRTVSLYAAERDHIEEHHPNMDFREIKKCVANPDSVYTSGTSDEREVMFRKPDGKSIYTKTVVEYEENGNGFVVTALPTKKEGGNVGEKLYPESGL